MGQLLQKTFPFYAVQIGEHVHVTRDTQQGKNWLKEGKEKNLPTKYKICRTWQEFKKFRAEVLSKFLVDKAEKRASELMAELGLAGLGI